MKIPVDLEDQEISNLHIMVKSFREKLPEDDPVQDALRNTELKLSGALRSRGWTPKEGGGWQQDARRRGMRF